MRYQGYFLKIVLGTRVQQSLTFICQIFRNNKALPTYLIDRKLKMSDVFIFEIKDAKRGKIFNFLKGCFSAMGGLTNMIFGVFSEIYKASKKYNLVIFLKI